MVRTSRDVLRRRVVRDGIGLADLHEEKACMLLAQREIRRARRGLYIWVSVWSVVGLDLDLVASSGARNDGRNHTHACIRKEKKTED